MRSTGLGLLTKAIVWVAVCATLGCRASKEYGGPAAGTGAGGEAGANGEGSSGGDGNTAASASECTPRQRSCDGRIPLVCQESGVWGPAQAACAVACFEGECAACAEDDVQCKDGVVQRCRDGAWTVDDVCDVTCEAGRCVDSCEEDRLQCNGDVLQRCDGLQYVDDSACDFLCRQGKCVGECMPDARRCNPEAPSEAQTCNTLGQWDDSVACPSGAFCVQGECKPCEPKARRCDETGPSLCSDQGEWEPQGACSEPTPACVDGECMTCSPGSKRCSGNTLLECNEEGSDWDIVETCSGATPACLESIDACGQCDASDKQCDGDTLQVCGDDGGWQVETVCSGSTPQCVDGACRACDPDVSERRCQNAQTAQECASSGSWGTTTACSGDTPVCRADLNHNCGCSEGERRCRSSTVPETCSGGAWVALPACSGALDHCLADTGQCVACQPGEEECQSGVAHVCNDAGAWVSLSSCAGDMVNCGGCDLGEPCDGNQDCVSNACVNDVCAACQPGAVGCAGTTPRSCSEAGAWVNQASCSGQTPVCQGGACVACQNGTTRSCGNCNLGTQMCSSGQWGACTGVPEDTLALGGNSKVFAELSDPNDDHSADLAWSPSSSRYALVYIDDGSTAGTTVVNLALLAQNGTINPNLVQTGVGQVREPAVAWGFDRFGVTWIEGAPGDADVMFTMVQGNGTYVGQDVFLEQGDVDMPRVGRFGSGNWFVVWRNFDGYGVLIEGQVPPPFQAGPATPIRLSSDLGPRGEPIAFDAAASDNEFGLFYKSADAGFFSTRFNTSFSATGSWPLTNAVGQGPRVAKTSNGYARAYLTATGVAVERYVLGAAASACHNANIEFGASNSSDDGVAIAATSDGLAVLATRAASNEVGFFALDNDCQVLRGPLTVTSTAKTPTLPRLAVGAAGFAAVWREAPESGVHQGWVRTFSNDLCD